MSRQFTAALHNHSTGDHNVLRTVWVTWDGDTVIVVQDSGGHGSGDDNDLELPQTQDGVGLPGETPITEPAVTQDGTDETATIHVSWFTSQQSSTGLPSISPSIGLSAAMSETQAPSSLTSSPAPTVFRSPNTSASATVSAEPTATVPAPPVPTSSTFVSHSPPYYVALIIGSIAGVAILAALVAWAARKRAREKRRRLADSAAKLPWIHSSGNDDNPLSGTPTTRDIENGMRSTDTEFGIMNLGSREAMAHVQAWEPGGDRDVGEPKRADFFFIDRKPRPPFITQEIPSHMLFSRYSVQEFPNESSAFPYANRASLGTIDTHLPMETLGRGSALMITNQVPGDISASSSQEAGAPCPSRDATSPCPDLGTPRELVPMPRFLGLDGKGLNVPWEQKALPSIPVDAQPRSRIMSAEHIRRTWERQAKPTKSVVDDVFAEGKQVRQEEGKCEGWVTSIRSNFSNAFSAVASSLPMSIKKDDNVEGHDHLTPVPLKRSIKRRVQDTDVLSHDGTIQGNLSRANSTAKSVVSDDPWSLVETGGNTGIVHIHMPVSDVCSVSSHEISDPGYGVLRSYTLHAHEPLQVRKKSTILLSKHRSSILSKDSRSRPSISRASSGIGSISPKRHRKAMNSIKRSTTLEKRSLLSSRTTSMDSALSISAISTGTEDMRELRSLAREALKDRRRKAERPKEITTR